MHNENIQYLLSRLNETIINLFQGSKNLQKKSDEKVMQFLKTNMSLCDNKNICDDYISRIFALNVKEMG